MISIREGYVIVDDWDAIWLETIASNRRDCWLRLGRVCVIPKGVLQKRGFKCVRVEIQTEEYKRSTY